MATEHVSKIEIADGCLHLILASGGQDHYQHIYREAMSVYWDMQRKSFKCSTSIPGLPVAELLPHIVRITGNFGIRLDFSTGPELVGLPDDSAEMIAAQVLQLSNS